MTITITAFSDSPDRGRGLARDMPVRWALAEVGQPHAMRRVSFAEMREPDHLARQPFGQIPTYEDGEVTLFESGAIVLRIADRYPGLLPADPAARARATAWMFAAVGTVEPAIVEREQAFLAERDRDWYAARLPLLDDRIRRRLDPLARRLGDADWLDGDFSAGDLMMISTLRRPAGSAIVAEHPNLAAYVARGEARAAFQRAFAEQHAAFVAGSTVDGG